MQHFPPTDARTTPSVENLLEPPAGVEREELPVQGEQVEEERGEGTIHHPKGSQLVERKSKPSQTYGHFQPETVPLLPAQTV